jgi:hypothetical protein
MGAPLVANIGAPGRRRRLLIGIGSSAAALAIVLLDLAARSPAWLVAVFALVFNGVLGVLQARDHT